MNGQELGPRLTVDQLREMTVVCVQRVDKPSIFATLWVERIKDGIVVFYAGETKTHFYVHRRDDGTMIDDIGNEIRTFEYLGKV